MAFYIIYKGASCLLYNFTLILNNSTSTTGSLTGFLDALELTQYSCSSFAGAVVPRLNTGFSFLFTYPDRAAFFDKIRGKAVFE